MAVVCLTCSKKLTCGQLSLSHGTNRKIKEEKNELKNNKSRSSRPSVDRILEWEGLRSRRRGGGVSPSPLGEGSGEEAVPPLQKKIAFLHQNHTSVMHSDTLLK